jgi:Tfp pilus assembly protein FimV
MSTITVNAGLSAPRRRAPRPVPSTRIAPARPAQLTRPAPAQLTRRGRLLFSVLTLVLLVAGAVLASGGGLASAGTEPSSPSAASTAERVTVRPGETLWAIAQREAPGVDPRETIARILDLTALSSSSVRAGSVLLIPGR